MRCSQRGLGRGGCCYTMLLLEFGRMIKDRLAAKVEELGLSVTLIDEDLGYEMRCADPIPFDAGDTPRAKAPPSRTSTSSATRDEPRQAPDRAPAAWGRAKE